MSFKKHYLFQGSPEWLHFRRFRIGASEAPIIMNVSPWCTPLQLYNQKIHGETVEMNAAMQRGKDLEPIALGIFCDYMEETYKPCVVESIYAPYIIASLDGLNILETCFVEIKCTGAKDHEIAKKGQIPEKYVPQLQHQLYVTGFQFGYYMSYRPEDSTPFVIIKVWRDEAYIDKMVRAEVAFYNCIMELIPPEPTDRDYQIVDDKELIVVADQLANAKKAKKDLDDLIDNLEKTLLSKVTYENFICGPIKTKTVTCKGKVNYKAITELITVDLDKYRGDPIQYKKISIISI